MAFSDGPSPFLVGFEPQDLGIAQIRRRRIQFCDELGGVGFQSWWPIQVSIDAMAIIASPPAVEDVSSLQDITFRFPARLSSRGLGQGINGRRHKFQSQPADDEQNTKYLQLGFLVHLVYLAFLVDLAVWSL